MFIHVSYAKSIPFGGYLGVFCNPHKKTQPANPLNNVKYFAIVQKLVQLLGAHIYKMLMLFHFLKRCDISKIDDAPPQL